MMQGISLCDHVTERDVTERAVIGLYDLIVERDYSLFPLPYKPLPYG